MKIAVVGCGALGSYYGAMLARLGEAVHFLLRSDFNVVSRNGVTIRSPAAGFNVHPLCARTPEEIGRSDLVLIGLKTTANDQFARLLPPLVGPHTAVVTLQNGLGNEEQLAKLFPAEQILGGLCFICLNRLEPGLIQHTAHGKVILGEFNRPAQPRPVQPRTHDLAALFRRAGVSCDVTENLARAHWEKLVWNIPFNGLGVAGAAGYDALVHHPSAISQLSRDCGGQLSSLMPTDQLLGDPRWETLVRELMAEVIATSNALGLEIPASAADKQVDRTRTMGAYKASTLVDFERGQPLELEGLFLEPLRQARAAGVATPRLAALCEVLRQLNPSNP